MLAEPRPDVVDGARRVRLRRFYRRSDLARSVLRIWSLPPCLFPSRPVPTRMGVIRVRVTNAFVTRYAVSLLSLTLPMGSCAIQGSETLGVFLLSTRLIVEVVMDGPSISSGIPETRGNEPRSELKEAIKRGPRPHRGEVVPCDEPVRSIPRTECQSSDPQTGRLHAGVAHFAVRREAIVDLYPRHERMPICPSTKRRDAVGEGAVAGVRGRAQVANLVLSATTRRFVQGQMVRPPASPVCRWRGCTTGNGNARKKVMHAQTCSSHARK